MDVMAHVAAPDDRFVMMISLGLATTDEIDLRVPQAVEHEFLTLLAAEDVHFGRIVEFSAGGGDWAAFSVALSATSVATCRLTRVLATFLERHKDKSVKISLGGKSFEAKGYSLDEVERLLKAVSEAKQADLEQWKRIAQPGLTSEPPHDA